MVPSLRADEYDTSPVPPLDNLHEFVGWYFARISHFFEYCFHLLFANLVLHADVCNHLLQVNKGNIVAFVFLGCLDKILLETGRKALSVAKRGEESRWSEVNNFFSEEANLASEIIRSTYFSLRYSSSASRRFSTAAVPCEERCLDVINIDPEELETCVLAFVNCLTATVRIFLFFFEFIIIPSWISLKSVAMDDAVYGLQGVRCSIHSFSQMETSLLFEFLSRASSFWLD